MKGAFIMNKEEYREYTMKLLNMIDDEKELKKLYVYANKSYIQCSENKEKHEKNYSNVI